MNHLKTLRKKSHSQSVVWHQCYRRKNTVLEKLGQNGQKLYFKKHSRVSLTFTCKCEKQLFIFNSAQYSPPNTRTGHSTLEEIALIGPEITVCFIWRSVQENEALTLQQMTRVCDTFYSPVLALIILALTFFHFKGSSNLSELLSGKTPCSLTKLGRAPCEVHVCRYGSSSCGSCGSLWHHTWAHPARSCFQYVERGENWAPIGQSTLSRYESNRYCSRATSNHGWGAKVNQPELMCPILW